MQCERSFRAGVSLGEVGAEAPFGVLGAGEKTVALCRGMSSIA